MSEGETYADKGVGSVTIETLTESFTAEPLSPSAATAQSDPYGGEGDDEVQALPPEEALVRFVTQAPARPNLGGLGREIGFCEADLAWFTEKCRIHVTAPHLVDERVMEDTHALGLEESRTRGTLQPHVTSVVLEDRRSGGLQMLSAGTPALALPMCFDYWDGRVITALTAEDRRSILDTYQQWTLEDFDVAAFTYTPLPLSVHQRLSHGSSSNSSSQPGGGGSQAGAAVAPPIYMVDNYTEAQQLAQLNAIREAANRERQARLAMDETPQLQVSATDGPLDNISIASPATTVTPTSEVTPLAHQEGLGKPPLMTRQVSEEQEGPSTGRGLAFTERFPSSASLAAGAGGGSSAAGSGGDGSEASTPVAGDEKLLGLAGVGVPLFIRSHSSSTLDSRRSRAGEDEHLSDKHLGSSLSVGEPGGRPISHPHGPWVKRTPSFDELQSGTAMGRRASSSLAPTAAALGPSVPTPFSAHTSGSSAAPLRSRSVPDVHDDMLWGLLQRQVFLGMLASSVLPKKEIPGFVEDVTAAGVRFIYFSPRNMRRTKALAEKMGIETDW